MTGGGDGGRRLESETDRSRAARGSVGAGLETDAQRVEGW